MESLPPRTRPLPVGPIFAAWMIYGALSAVQVHALLLSRGHESTWLHSFARGGLESFLWTLMTLAIFWLARRYPLERRGLARVVPIHLAGAVALAVARALVLVELSRRLTWLPERAFEAQFLTHFHTYIIFYWFILGLAHALDYNARLREKERATERLQAGLTEARLQALKMQLHPHFLFNTLHAISALIPAEARPARRMLANLGELLRATLEHEDTQLVTLREELAFLQPYLEIERTRLGERLTVTLNVEPDALDARVPHLVLQPLVENAIRHGIAPRVEPGEIEIVARLTHGGERLRVEVRDDGRGLTPRSAAAAAAAGPERGGVGLGNIRARLDQLYGPGHGFAIEPREGGGVTVRLDVPLHAPAAVSTAEAS